AARPEPDVWSKLIGVAAVVARSRQPADAAVLLDHGDDIAFFRQVIGHRRSGHAAAKYQDLFVHALVSFAPFRFESCPRFALAMPKSCRPAVTNRPNSTPFLVSAMRPSPEIS